MEEEDCSPIFDKLEWNGARVLRILSHFKASLQISSSSGGTNLNKMCLAFGLLYFYKRVRGDFQIINRDREGARNTKLIRATEGKQ